MLIPLTPNLSFEQSAYPTAQPRKFTDPLCCVAIIVHWLAMTIVGCVYANSGNMYALFAATDYKGRLCGVDSSVVDKPYGYIVNSNLDMKCISGCYEGTKDINIGVSAYENMACLDDLIGDEYKDMSLTDYFDSSSDRYADAQDYYFDYSTLFNQGSGNCNFRIACYTVGLYCVFNPDATIPNVTVEGDFDDMVESVAGSVASAVPNQGERVSKIMGASMSADGFFGEFMQDLYTAKDYIFGYGFVVALLVAFAYTKMMSMNFPCMSFGVLDILVWGTVFVTGLLFMTLAAYMTQYYRDQEALDPQTNTEDNLKYMKYVMYFTWVFFIGYICFILAIMAKIKLCIALTKAAGNAVRDISLVVLFPLVLVFGLCLFLVPWIYYSLYVNAQGCYERINGTSTGTGTNGTDEVWHSYTWQWSSSAYYILECEGKNKCDGLCPTSDEALAAQYFLVFCYFWTSQFIIAIGQLILSLTFFLWYFTLDDVAETKTVVDKDGNEKEVTTCYGKYCQVTSAWRGNNLLLKACCKVWYHVGSAAFGSLIIAIIKFIRYLIMKAQEKAKQSGNKAAQYALMALQCCMWCLEKCMKFINKHAYIIIAVDGKIGFCGAAMKSFFLILRNIRLIACVTLVQAVVTNIGKVMVIVCTGALAYFAIAGEFGDQLNSPIGPTLFVMIMAYFVADMFMEVYAMAIDVLMHCFMTDKETHDPPGEAGSDTEPYCLRKTAPHLKPLNSCELPVCLRIIAALNHRRLTPFILPHSSARLARVGTTTSHKSKQAQEKEKVQEVRKEGLQDPRRMQNA